MYNGICLILVFTLVRILQIVPNWRIFFELMNTAEWASIEFRYKLICVGSCVPLDVLNVYWFTKIINIVIKTLMGGKSSEKELKEKSSAKELKAE